MTQTFENVPATEKVRDSRAKLLQRDEALRANFAGATAPTDPAPVEGQKWYDTTVDKTKTYNGSSWVIEAPSVSDDDTLGGGSPSATIPPSQAAVKGYVDDGDATLVASIATKAPSASPTFTGAPAAPTAAASTNTTQIATTAMVQSAIALYVASQDVEILKGGIDCSANPNYPAADAGWGYRVTVAGKIGGASGVNVEVNDKLLCLNDSTASGNHATVGANWLILQTNVDGAVVGPTSAVANNIVLFNGTTGRIVKDSGYSIDVLTGGVPSLDAFGSLASSADTALTAFIASAYHDVRVPPGQWTSTLTTPTTDIPNKKLLGPGQISINSKFQAPMRSVVTAAVTAPPSDDRYEVFHNGFPASFQASFFGCYGTTPTGTPGSTYKNFPHLSPFFHVHDWTSGYNTDPADHALGRSGAFVHLDRVYHGGQGDLTAYSFYGEIYSARAGATHFLANPALAFHNASFGISAAGGNGGYLQGSEYLFSDGGYYCAAIDRVRNFVRNNNATTLGVVWGVDRIQTGGTYALDFIMSVQAKLKRGIDFTPCIDMGTDKALVVFPSTGRLYLDATATADSAGIKWNASSVGGVYIVSASSDFRIGVGGADAYIATASALAPAVNDNATLGTASLSWGDLFGATGFTWNIGNGNWVATHSSAILTVSTGDLRVTTAGANSASVATLGGTQTLTNKTLASPTITGNISQQSGSAFSPQNLIQNNTNDANSAYYIFRKNRAGAAVQVGDALGTLMFSGYDSASAAQNAAYISAQVATVGSGSVVARLQLVSGGDVFEIDGSAHRINMPTGAYLSINGDRIIGARKTGWGVPTGTLTRTTYDTATVTLPQLAERVAALVNDIHASGASSPSHMLLAA